MGVSRTTGRVKHSVWVCGLVMLLAGGVAISAQFPTRGQDISPAFEGWEQNPDGSFNLLFGYFNRNWDEEIGVPIGPNNSIEPGGPDQGQPTHFYPRRSFFVFRIRVPKDFGKQELMWTLTTNGKTQRAYGTLNPDYMLDAGVIQINNGGENLPNFSNVAPTLKVDGEATRLAKVSTPVTLTAVATDDGIPKTRPMSPAGSPDSPTLRGAAGLRFSWLVYRAAGNVTFDPPQFNAWVDTRDGRNSPYSGGWVTPPLPPGNTWVVRATFHLPGTYVLRAQAHDGALSTIRDVTFVVTP